MKFFLLFLILSFFFGIFAVRVNPKKRNWALFLFCVGMIGIYFFFNKI